MYSDWHIGPLLFYHVEKICEEKEEIFKREWIWKRGKICGVILCFIIFCLFFSHKKIKYIWIFTWGISFKRRWRTKRNWILKEVKRLGEIGSEEEEESEYLDDKQEKEKRRLNLKIKKKRIKKKKKSGEKKKWKVERKKRKKKRSLMKLEKES